MALSHYSSIGSEVLKTQPLVDQRVPLEYIDITHLLTIVYQNHRVRFNLIWQPMTIPLIYDPVVVPRPSQVAMAARSNTQISSGR